MQGVVRHQHEKRLLGFDRFADLFVGLQRQCLCQIRIAFIVFLKMGHVVRHILSIFRVIAIMVSTVITFRTPPGSTTNIYIKTQVQGVRAFRSERAEVCLAQKQRPVAYRL